MKILPPTYTQVPNVILDNLYKLDRTEVSLVMVLCRLTFGYHKPDTKASYSVLAKKSGLAISTVMRAAKRLEEKGWITHSLNSNRAAIWSINVTDVDETKDASNPDEPKKTKQEPLFDKAQAMAEVCKMDFDANKGMLLNQAKRMPLSSEEIKDLFGPNGAWYRLDFRGKKNSPPSIKQLFSEFKKLKETEQNIAFDQENVPATKALIKDDELYL